MNNSPTPSFTPYDPTPMPRKPSYIFTRADFWLAVALWLVGYLYVSVLPVAEHPLPAMAVQLLLPVGTLLLLRRSLRDSLRCTPWIWVLLGVSMALSLSFLWSVNRAVLNSLTVWNALAWFYLVFSLTGNSRERRPGAYFVGELLTSVAMPFRSPGSAFGALFAPKRAEDGTPLASNRLRSTVGWVCLGLFLAIIPTVIITLLLSYDEGFSTVMGNMFDSIFSATTLFRQIRNIGIGLLVGALLFGAILAGKTHSTKARTEESNAGAAPLSPSMPRDGAHVLPVALVAAMLTPIMAVYGIFFFSQWDYYVSAFTGVRPEELTFATYAREGFFQLVAVAVINACLSLGAGIFSRRRAVDPDRPQRERTSPVIRVYLGVLALMTLVLIATALSKMLLYVDAYGMTHKRVYATWLMVLLAVAFVAVILRQVWTHLNLTGTLVAAFLAFFLLIALAPVDALIVRCNVNAALDGNLRTMQGNVCSDSGAAGVLAALDFMEATEDPAVAARFDPDKLASVRAETADYLARMREELWGMEWYAHNITTLRAKEALTRTGYTADKTNDA